MTIFEVFDAIGSYPPPTPISDRKCHFWGVCDQMPIYAEFYEFVVLHKLDIWDRFVTQPPIRSVFGGV